MSSLFPPVGRLEAIWLKRVKRGPMDLVTQAVLVAGSGLKGNADHGGRRQVTILEKEIWDRLMNDLHGTLLPSARRANLLISSFSLLRSRKRILQIGNCRIQIRGETRPCERMEEAFPGLRKAMEKAWHGGAFGQVLDDGHIQVGDVVRWTDELRSPAD